MSIENNKVEVYVIVCGPQGAHKPAVVKFLAEKLGPCQAIFMIADSISNAKHMFRPSFTNFLREFRMLIDARVVNRNGEEE